MNMLGRDGFFRIICFPIGTTDEPAPTEIETTDERR